MDHKTAKRLEEKVRLLVGDEDYNKMKTDLKRAVRNRHKRLRRQGKKGY